MTANANALASLTNQSSNTLFLSTVSELVDPKVNVDLGGVPVTVSCSSGYTSRAVGDVVVIARTPGGLLVLGRVNSPDLDLSALALVPALKTSVDELAGFSGLLEDKVERLDGLRATNNYGTGTAPSGYVQADSVWFKDMGGGKVDLYLRRATDPGTPTTAPPKPPTQSKPRTVPSPVTLQPSWEGAWRSNGQSDTYPKQGAWTGSNWFGGWGFENRIENACNGKSVASMKFVLSRSKSGGVYTKSPMNLYLHERSSRGAPSATSSKVVVKIEPGGRRVWTLPTSWTNALANGNAKGIMIKGSGQSEYIITDSRAGSLTITFS